MLIALAVSTTRATSTAVTSRLSRTITMPELFWPRMWLPVMPVCTRSILQAAIISASFSACWMLCTVASMFTTTPRFRPCDADTPRPASRMLALGQHLGDHAHHLGGADVQPDDQILVFLGHLVCPWVSSCAMRSWWW